MSVNELLLGRQILTNALNSGDFQHTQEPCLTMIVLIEL